MGSAAPALVTGAGGQLGRALAGAIPGGVYLDRRDLDITDAEAVRSVIGEYRPDAIINAAAYTKVDAAEEEPTAAFRVNAQGVENLAVASESHGALLVQVSTDYVFSGEKETPYTEEDPPSPMSVYGKSKLEGEIAATMSSRHLIVRTSWVFGQGRNFISAISSAARSRPELEVVNDQWGLPTFASDLAGGILDLMKAGATGLFHLAGGSTPCTWADLAAFALSELGLEASVKGVSTDSYFENRPGPIAPRPRNSVLDCSKAKKLGIELRPWQQGVSEYVKGLL